MSPFALAKQHPNEFMIDHRTSGMKIQEPVFVENEEDALKELKNIQNKGHIASLYKIDENGKTSFFKK